MQVLTHFDTVKNAGLQYLEMASHSAGLNAYFFLEEVVRLKEQQRPECLRPTLDLSSADYASVKGTFESWHNYEFDAPDQGDLFRDHIHRFKDGSCVAVASDGQTIKIIPWAFFCDDPRSTKALEDVSRLSSAFENAPKLAIGRKNSRHAADGRMAFAFFRDHPPVISIDKLLRDMVIWASHELGSPSEVSIRIKGAIVLPNGELGYHQIKIEQYLDDDEPHHLPENHPVRKRIQSFLLGPNSPLSPHGWICYRDGLTEMIEARSYLPGVSKVTSHDYIAALNRMRNTPGF